MKCISQVHRLFHLARAGKTLPGGVKYSRLELR